MAYPKGTKVVVVDNGWVYSGYKDGATALGLTNFTVGRSVRDGAIGEVIDSTKHLGYTQAMRMLLDDEELHKELDIFENSTIYGVEIEGRHYVVGEQGLTDVTE